MIAEIKDNIDEFKKIIDSAFKKVDKRKRGLIATGDLKKLLNLFGQFPTDAEIRELILPRINNGHNSSTIKYKDFEKYMLGPLLESVIDIDDTGSLLKAFQTLDSEKKKYIPLKDFKKILNDGSVI